MEDQVVTWERYMLSVHWALYAARASLGADGLTHVAQYNYAMCNLVAGMMLVLLVVIGIVVRFIVYLRS